MIRRFLVDDLARIAEMLRADPLIYPEEVLTEISRNQETAWVYEQDNIKGFAYTKLNREELKHHMIRLYVTPPERRKGIGIRLYREAMDNLEKSKPNLISTDFAVDNGDSAPFYRQLGFKKWYACINLEYNGGPQPDPGQNFVPYEEKYLEEYVKVCQESFYELHRDNDIYPYRPSGDEFMKDFVRSRADRTYLALDGDRIMAATIFRDDCLEFLMVSPDYQGQGLGRKAAQFAMNSLLANGPKTLNVCCVVGNNRADTLYRSLGFEPVTTYHVYRQFGDRD